MRWTLSCLGRSLPAAMAWQPMEINPKVCKGRRGLRERKGLRDRAWVVRVGWGWAMRRPLSPALTTCHLYCLPDAEQSESPPQADAALSPSIPRHPAVPGQPQLERYRCAGRGRTCGAALRPRPPRGAPPRAGGAGGGARARPAGGAAPPRVMLCHWGGGGGRRGCLGRASRPL